jgi:hypothetical protein
MTSKSTNGRKAARTGAAAPRFFSIGDVADCLSVSPRTVSRWIKSRVLTVHEIEGIKRISEKDFAAFLAVRRGV